MVLAGMSGALGALFPTPLLGVLMIYELGSPPGTTWRVSLSSLPRHYAPLLCTTSSWTILMFITTKPITH